MRDFLAVFASRLYILFRSANSPVHAIYMFGVPVFVAPFSLASTWNAVHRVCVSLGRLSLSAVQMLTTLCLRL